MGNPFRIHLPLSTIAPGTMQPFPPSEYASRSGLRSIWEIKRGAYGSLRCQQRPSGPARFPNLIVLDLCCLPFSISIGRASPDRAGARSYHLQG